MLISNYEALRNVKKTVDARRANRIQMKRKLRLASYVGMPRLRKGFHNRPTAFSSAVIK